MDKWEDLLNPDNMREKLISASLYITAFEILKESICGRIRSFYSIGFDSSGLVIDDKYSSEVLSRKSSVLYASLDWLVEHEVIDTHDLVSFERVKSARNKIAHELQSFILGGLDFGHMEMFGELAALLSKIETWWIINFEIPINPDFDEQEIDETGIVPGPVMMLKIMLDVASGSEELLDHYRAQSSK
jgi:hypothetical protein